MNRIKTILLAALAVTVMAGQQDVSQPTFDVSGTPIPADLLKMNYGPLPKGIAGFDLNICNVSAQRHSVTSSEIYQALMTAQNTLQPVGRQIMLVAILRNQNHSVANILSMALGSTTSALSVVNMGKGGASSGWGAGLALGSLIAQQVLANWKPVLTADQVEKFESQVLEPALVLDAGSCVERTVFTATLTPPAKKPESFQFHVR